MNWGRHPRSGLQQEGNPAPGLWSFWGGRGLPQSFVLGLSSTAIATALTPPLSKAGARPHGRANGTGHERAGECVRAAHHPYAQA